MSHEVKKIGRFVHVRDATGCVRYINPDYVEEVVADERSKIIILASGHKVDLGSGWDEGKLVKALSSLQWMERL